MEQLQNIIKEFKENEVSKYGSLNKEVKAMISIVVLTTLGTVKEIKREVEEALKLDILPDYLSEAAIQCTPYVGYSKVMEALEVINATLKENGVSVPLDNQSGTTEADRFEKGLKAQYDIFGKDLIDNMRAAAPEELKHIQDYLSGYCFGDFYTRKVIDLKTRELLTFCCLSALGGCDSQVRSHIVGNLNVGNGREVLLSAITWCVPYIGFPRTLNAIQAINEITKK